MLQKTGDIEIETGVVYKDNHVGMPCNNVFLAARHVAEYRAKMQQHGHETHVGKFPIVFYARSPHGRHQVASEETELGFMVIPFQ